MVYCSCDGAGLPTRVHCPTDGTGTVCGMGQCLGAVGFGGPCILCGASSGAVCAALCRKSLRRALQGPAPVTVAFKPPHMVGRAPCVFP